MPFAPCPDRSAERTQELLEKVRQRKADDVCLCCGDALDVTSWRLQCGCKFCDSCTRRAHNTHEGPFAIPCVEAI
jgi:hypothetical protein